MTSSATVSPTLLGIIGIGAVTVNGASTAQSAAYGLELALVLDVTGSMAGNNAIGSLRTAANNLLNILYGGADTQPHLWVSVVPFAATINIGTQHTSWLVTDSLDQSKYRPRSWMGCVMARTYLTGAQDGDDFNDKTPAQAAFTPFFYNSTSHRKSYTTTDNKGNKTTHYYTGDNDWTPRPPRETATMALTSTVPLKRKQFYRRPPARPRSRMSLTVCHQPIAVARSSISACRPAGSHSARTGEDCGATPTCRSTTTRHT